MDFERQKTQQRPVDLPVGWLGSVRDSAVCRLAKSSAHLGCCKMYECASTDLHNLVRAHETIAAGQERVSTYELDYAIATRTDTETDRQTASSTGFCKVLGTDSLPVAAAGPI